MQQPGLLETVLIGALVVAVLMWFGPGIKGAMAMTRAAEKPDWMGVAVPLAAVVAFVVFLIWAS